MALITGKDHRLYRVHVIERLFDGRVRHEYLGPYNSVVPAKGQITREKRYRDSSRWRSQHSDTSLYEYQIEYLEPDWKPLV